MPAVVLPLSVSPTTRYTAGFCTTETSSALQKDSNKESYRHQGMVQRRHRLREELPDSEGSEKEDLGPLEL